MNTVLIDNYARLIADYSLRVAPGDRVLIRSSYLAEPFLNSLSREILSKGGIPDFRISLSGSERIFYEHASDDVLTYVGKNEEFIYENYECFLTVKAPFNLKELSGISSERKMKKAAAGAPLHEIFSRRSAEGSLRWCICQYPVQSQAQESGMSVEDYAAFVAKACFLDAPDPVERWNALSRDQESICVLLNGKKNIRVVAPGTDLSFSIDRRRWINSDGRRNMPSGEVFTTPVEESVSGTLFVSYPLIYMGEVIEGAELVFEDGEVTKFRADKGEKILSELLKVPGANRLGEGAIGTNYGIDRFTNNILFDEKMGGTAHFALGDSYAETGGKNKSAIHLDMIIDLKNSSTIFADGEQIYQNGNFFKDLLRG